MIDAASSTNKWREYLWYYAPLIVWIAVIFAASSNTGSMSNTSRIIGPILAFLLPGASEAELVEIHGFIRKGAHLTFYAILGWLAARAFSAQTTNRILRQNWIAFAFAVTILTAAIDETNQSFLRSRTGSVYDVLLDSIGGALAILLFAIVWRKRNSAV